MGRVLAGGPCQGAELVEGLRALIIVSGGLAFVKLFSLYFSFLLSFDCY